MHGPPSDDVLEALAALVETRSGLHFEGARRDELIGKAARAFQASGCATWSDYLQRVSEESGAALLDELLEALTVGETYFFRHRAAFDLLEREILPALVAERSASRQLRIWCAGCATGEEVYSLAIVLRRLLPAPSEWQLSLLATDLNRSFLARAQAGLYGDWSFREESAGERDAYFVPEGREFRVHPRLRAMVRFAHLNLVEETYPSAANGTARQDLVLCRNVLLYFAPATARRVLARLRAALAPGGWLMLGPSDPAPGAFDGLRMRSTGQAIAFQRVDEPSSPLGDPAGSSPPLAECGRLAGLALPLTPAPVAAASGGALLPLDEGPARAAPDAWEAAWRAAYTCARRGELDLAEQHCRQAIVCAGLRPEPYYLLGTLRRAAGDDAAARAAFRQALYADRAFAPAYLALAALHRAAGRPALAHQALRRAEHLLAGRAPHELVLAEEGLTVGRLRDVLAHGLSALAGEGRG